MVDAIQVVNLSKQFPCVGAGWGLLRLPFAHGNGHRSLDQISLTVKPGEVFGLVGPNGAGKTTLLKILCTLLEPDRGRAAVMGYDVVEQAAAARRQLGYCPGFERSFYLRLSARENLRFYGILNNLSARLLAQRMSDLLAALELAAAANQPVQTFSTGMLQRLAVARALLHGPRVALFDEPTRSLDPAGAAWLRQYLRGELADRQAMTILLATHNLSEIEEICDRVAVLNRGCVVALGTPAAICRQTGAATLRDAYLRLTRREDLPAESALR